MKAVVLTGLRETSLVDIDTPTIGAPRDVLLRIKRVGVCASDIHYFDEGRIGTQVIEAPFVVGHEFSGVVAEVGSGVDGVAPGDRVAVDPAVSCGTCDQCLAGRRHTCRKLLFVGCPGQLGGALKEYIALPEECCFKLAPETTLEEGALIEPLSIGVYSALQAGPLGAMHVGIIGCGPIGLSTALAAQHFGTAALYMIDELTGRLDVAANNLHCWTGNSLTQDVVSEIGRSQPGMLDVVLECCGEQSALDMAIELLKPGGRLAIVGIPAVDSVVFPSHTMRRKEITILNIRRQNECVQKALDLVEDGSIDVGFMETHHFDLPDTQTALEVVSSRADGVIKAFVHV